jgi:hypothetical protein
MFQTLLVNLEEAFHIADGGQRPILDDERATSGSTEFVGNAGQVGFVPKHAITPGCSYVCTQQI